MKNSAPSGNSRAPPRAFGAPPPEGLCEGYPPTESWSGNRPLICREASPRAKTTLIFSLLFPSSLFLAHGVPPGYGRWSPRAARARASAPEWHGSCCARGPRAVPRMPPVFTLPNLRAARGCPFARRPGPPPANDPQWGAAGGGAGASGVAALTHGPRAARSLAPLLLQARSRSTASSPSSWASSCSSSSAAGRMQTRSQQVGARAAPPCHAPPRAMSPLTRHDGRAGDRGDRKRPGVRGAGVRDRGHQRRPPQPRDLDGVCRDGTVTTPRSHPAFARALWCLPAGVSAAPARPPCADGGAARNRLGKQRYACYCAAQVMGAIFGALALKLALPPAMDETPFTTTGSLTFSHPFQVRDERRRALPPACAWVCVHSQRTRARAPGFLPGVCLHIYAGVLRFRHCRGQIGR